MADDFFGALFRLGKNAALTAHAAAAAPLLEDLAAHEECIEECAQAACAEDGEAWKRLNAADRQMYRDISRAVLRAQARWYKREVNERVKRALVGDDRGGKR